ncbi:proteasome complex subunit Rpn13 ubiquitin receptor-domain-containing protein [Leptodontidium sp. 2 PMI_412]|nr:proteasome complex subunit Rpn13 ubiquitin receptor-domain-containing protein [Leptodontidium sp. MPI-SDFR-AT-0119]KAH9210552.1 proteasome complex subunit Rpn13 ubiquitin receptor-domain-containing protein [Leptodontidium sp. 2 PMI_412]
MSISPIITFKAGRCALDTSSKPYKVTPDPTPGYIYLYSEDELIHFCWRERNKPMTDPDNIDLVMFPTDGHFEPYEYKTSQQATSKTNGRIFALKFSSSSRRDLFWLQSKPQARNGDASWFSPRDLKIGQIVDTLLQGDEVNVSEEIAQVQGGTGGNDDDETMEDVEGHGDQADHHRGGSGGAGPGATGGDIREEGSGAREGGADGGRAAGSGPTDAATVVQNFLNSLKAGGQAGMQQVQGQIYTTLPDLLPTSITVPTIDSATPAQIDNLLSYLPPTVLLIAQESAASIDGMVEPSAESASAAIEALSVDQKKSILKKVLRSPQFHQSLGSLTMAIRDGGLPSIADALGIKLEHGGLVRGGSVPLGGGDAVEAFIEGVKKTVEKE